MQIDSFGTMSLYTLSKDVRVYRIRNTKGEDKTEVNGNLEFAFCNNILYIDITYST